MKQFTLLDDTQFRFVTFGNGLAYSLTHKPSRRALFVQGDDALQLEHDLDAIEKAMPAKTYTQCIAWLWDQCDYKSMAGYDLA